MAGLSRDRWQAIGPLLDRALEMSDAERVAWLDALRDEEPALAADLDELLALRADADRDSFLELAPPPGPPGA